MEESKTVGHNAGAKRGSETRRAAVVECFVPTCDSKMGSVSRRNNVTFHNFPKKPSLRLRWKRAVRNAEPPGDASKVCSLHFDEDDYKCESLRNLLNDDAVPSQCLPAAQRQTRYQARLATEPTAEADDSEAALDSTEGPADSSEDLASKEEEDVVAREREATLPERENARTPEPPAAPARTRRHRRNRHFSSNKLKNRLKRAERRGRRSPAGSRPPTAGEETKKTYSEKIREFREALVGGRRSTRIGRWGGPVAGTPETSPASTSPKRPSNSFLALKTYPPKNRPRLGEPPKRFVALEMGVAPSPPTRKPFVALEMGVAASLPNHRAKLPPRESFVVCSSDAKARLTDGAKPQVHTVKGQTCCVPGCATSHEPGGAGQPVFSFPTDPGWKARWNKSIFGDAKRTSSPTVPLSTGKDGSKIFVHRRQLKMPISAYRALFSIPGWGRTKGVPTGGATVVIDRRDSMVCSAHFLDGKPTATNPIPRLNLRPNTEEMEGAEVRPEVHDDHTYAADALPTPADGRPADERALATTTEMSPPGLPTPPKLPTDVMPVAPVPRAVSPPPAPEGETAARRRAEGKARSKTDRCATRKKSVDHKDHTYAVLSELNDLDKSDHTYAFVISEVKNTDSTIWGQYSVSPLAQACYTTGSESFTEDQDLFYATVKQEVEDDFDASPLVADRRFASDWDRLPAIKQEPAEPEPEPEPECGSFHFVDVSNFMNDYRADFEDLGSLDPVLASK